MPRVGEQRHRMAEHAEHGFRQHEPDVQHGPQRERRSEVGGRVVMVVAVMAMIMPMAVVMSVRRSPVRCGGVASRMTVLVFVLMRVIVGVIVRAHGERPYPEPSSGPTP